MTLAVVLALLGGIAAGWGLTRLGLLPRGKRRRRYTPTGETPVAPLGVPVRLDETRDLLRAAYRTDELPEPEDARRADQRELERALRDVADVHGAATATLWTVPTGEGSVPVALAAALGDTAPVLTEGQAGLAVWAAREGMLSFEGSREVPRFASAPVPLLGQAGALTLHLREESGVGRDALKAWLPRHAAAVGALYELVRTRAEVARSNFRLRATIRSAMTLQGTRDPLELEEVLVGQVLDVAGAQWSMLVRWDVATGSGLLRSAAGVELPEDPAMRRVTDATLAGVVCQEGAPLVFVDARNVASDARAVLDHVPLPAGTQSLLIVPLRRRKEERPIGALICGHSEMAAFSQGDARTTQELGVVASGALETAWAVNDEREVARTDPLTGLANRRKFEEHFRRSVEWTDRHAGSTLALVLADVDFFKKINDTWGHDIGDAVLVAVGRALQKDRRSLDVVARLGGEEFALLLPSTTLEGAREVAERVRLRLEDLEIPTDAGLVRLTASFGVAQYAARAGDQELVFERADKALYAAKRNGRNRVEVARERRSGETSAGA